MPRIKMLERDFSPEVKELYDGQVAEHGKITNMKRTLLNHPLSFKVLMEWYPLYYQMIDVVGLFAANAFSFAVSAENDCLICSTFFRKILKDDGRDPDNLVLSEAEEDVIAYGRALVTNPRTIPDSLFDRLKKRYTEADIVLFTAFGGMMIATNLINSALQVPLDGYLTEYTKK